MPTTTYQQARLCQCGYSTLSISSWCRHKRNCQTLQKSLEVEQLLRQQLVVKDEQLAIKDKQIESLMQLSNNHVICNDNSTNNNHQRYWVSHNVNNFGRECVAHITDQQVRALLEDPPSAVSQYIKLKHKRSPDGVNLNVRVPNLKRAIYQVVVPGQEEGTKEWENQAKGDVLEQLYDLNSCTLEMEADEDTRVGARFINHQDKIRESASGSDGGRKYKEQLDKIHCVISS